MKKILKNNNGIIINEWKDKIIIEKLWNDEAFMFEIDKKEIIPDFSSIKFHEELCAMHDIKKNKIEFIFTLLDENEKLKDLKFIFYFEGQEYKCYFKAPSKKLIFLAKNFIIKSPESHSWYRNLRIFNDYYSKNLYKKFKPYNFYIDWFNLNNKDKIEEFIKSFNFYTNYFYRRMPSLIYIKNPEIEEKFKIPCFYNKNNFPEKIITNKIEKTLLDILTFARNNTNNTRLQFILYFQIIEYVSYYYLDDNLNSKLSKILKNPDINEKSHDYSKEIINILQNYYKNTDKNDNKKIETIISDFIWPNDLINELNENISIFNKDIIFDWWFQLCKINSEDSFKKLDTNDIKNISNNIINIRNVLVHLRHKNENVSILPTKKNDNLIKPYLYLLTRISEIIAIKYN